MVDEASDGAYVLQGLDTVFTLQDWISAGKQDYSGLAVINNGKRLVIDPKNMKKFEAEDYYTYGDLPEDVRIDMSKDDEYATMVDYISNDPYTQVFVSEGRFNGQLPYIMTFNDACRLQMYGKQINDICSGIGIEAPENFIFTCDYIGVLSPIARIEANDYSSIDEAALAVEFPENGTFYFIPMYDMDETLEEKIQDYM